MTALEASIIRECQVHTPQESVVPINDDSIIFAGSLVMREAATDVAVPGADTTDCVFLGVALEELDNTNGGDGEVSGLLAERCVRVDRAGAWAFATTGSPKRGEAAFIIDDNTVAPA